MSYKQIEEKVTRVNEDIKTFKANLADALNAKGVPTSKKDSTVQMVENIGKIQGGAELPDFVQVPMDKVQLPKARRIIENEGNDYQTWGSVWLPEKQAFLVFGENYGANFSIVELNGNVTRYGMKDYLGANQFYYDEVDNCIIVGLEQKQIAKYNLSGDEIWRTNYAEQISPEMQEHSCECSFIKRHGDCYYVSLGINDVYRGSHVLKLSLTGEVLGIVNFILQDEVDNSYDQCQLGTLNFFDNKIIIRTTSELIILTEDLQIIKRFAMDWIYEMGMQEIFKYEDYYMIHNGTCMRLLQKDTLEFLTNEDGGLFEIGSFYYTGFIRRLSENKFFTITNGYMRIITMDGIYNVGQEDIGQYNVKSFTIMEDGCYLCEVDERIVIKFNPDFSEEWKVETYGLYNGDPVRSRNWEVATTVGDYIYLVRKAGVLELNFVPNCIVTLK